MEKETSKETRNKRIFNTGYKANICSTCVIHWIIVMLFEKHFQTRFIHK